MQAESLQGEPWRTSICKGKQDEDRAEGEGKLPSAAAQVSAH